MSRTMRTVVLVAVLVAGVECSTGFGKSKSVQEELEEENEGEPSRARALGAREDVPLESSEPAQKNISPAALEPTEAGGPEDLELAVMERSASLGPEESKEESALPTAPGIADRSASEKAPELAEDSSEGIGPPAQETTASAEDGDPSDKAEPDSAATLVHPKGLSPLGAGDAERDGELAAVPRELEASDDDDDVAAAAEEEEGEAVAQTADAAEGPPPADDASQEAPKLAEDAEGKSDVQGRTGTEADEARAPGERLGMPEAGTEPPKGGAGNEERALGPASAAQEAVAPGLAELATKGIPKDEAAVEERVSRETPELPEEAVPPLALHMAEDVRRLLRENAEALLEEVPGSGGEVVDVEASVTAEGSPSADAEREGDSAMEAGRPPEDGKRVPTITEALGPAGSFELSTDMVRGEQETISLATENVTLELVLTSDGVLRTLGLSGQEGENVTFLLAIGPKTLGWYLVVGRGGGRISCWPVKGFAATADEGGLSLKAETAGSVFALATRDVGPDGVKVWCDGEAAVLHDGQRMDSRVVGEDGIAFAVTDSGQPREQAPRELARTKWKNGPRPADEPKQGTHGPLRPWQTLFLPTVESYVVRPEDISP